MADEYRDRWISCDADGLRVRWYYLWGAKRIRYASIRSVQRVELSTFRGRGRIWGTANPKYWASLDPGRPQKRFGLILDLGHFVQPLLTPDDVDAVERIVRGHAGLPSSAFTTRDPTTRDPTIRGPVV